MCRIPQLTQNILRRNLSLVVTDNEQITSQYTNSIIGQNNEMQAKGYRLID